MPVGSRPFFALSIALCFALGCGDKDPGEDSGDSAIPAVEGDGDGDSFTPDDGDCDDANAQIHPGATEVCDGIDNDCDGLIDDDDPNVAQDCDNVDADGDGYAASEECDDGDANVHPDAEEICDGIDNDCDGAIDAIDSDVEDCGGAQTTPNCNPSIPADAQVVEAGIDSMGGALWVCSGAMAWLYGSGTIFAEPDSFSEINEEGWVLYAKAGSTASINAGDGTIVKEPGATLDFIGGLDSSQFETIECVLGELQFDATSISGGCD